MKNVSSKLEENLGKKSTQVQVVQTPQQYWAVWYSNWYTRREECIYKIKIGKWKLYRPHNLDTIFLENLQWFSHGKDWLIQEIIICELKTEDCNLKIAYVFQCPISTVNNSDNLNVLHKTFLINVMQAWLFWVMVFT